MIPSIWKKNGLESYVVILTQAYDENLNSYSYVYCDYKESQVVMTSEKDWFLKNYEPYKA